VTDERRNLIMVAYLIGFVLQGAGTILLAVRAMREATANIMERAAREGRALMTGDGPSRRQRARPVVVPAVLLLLGLGFELAATRTWLYS
jgi:hypothetical protein